MNSDNRRKHLSIVMAGPVATLLVTAALAQSAPGIGSGQASSATEDTVVVTARLRREDAQTVPISLSVVDGATLQRTRTDNISELSQLVPSLNYVSPNPRNTAFTIRGLGSSVLAIAQSNDGLEPGVGFYVDQVYHGRPATAAFDFMDLNRVEVLRGPQGTLFGKNTTAGAINITTQAPTFDREVAAEASGGNYGNYQAKAYLSGALFGDVVAGRVSAATTGHNGVLKNVTTGVDNNDVHNSEARAQLLIAPSGALRVRLIADYSSFNSDCCTQVFVGVGTSLKSPAKQYPALAGGLSYAPPSLNPFDRLTDIDAGLKVATNEGGLSAATDWNLGSATLTSVSAWRWWNWDAANDRDYTGLSIQTLQHIPSRQDQYSQEFRIASNGTHAIDYVAGLYWFDQTLTGEPITQYGPLAAYWLLGPAPAYPGNLLSGYTTDGHTRFHSDSYAAFGEGVWHVTSRLAVTAGVRYTVENKQGRFDSTVFGGLATTNTTLLNAKLSILRPQSYRATVNDGAASGRVNFSYELTDEVMAYAVFSRGNKSGGINMSGLPLNAANLPALSTAVIKPERNTTGELGVKTRFFDRRLLLNVDLYDTEVRDFQTNVVDTGPGALRGYLANIEKVKVQGVEADATFRVSHHFDAHLSSAWTDGKYVSYKNGPCPLEQIGNATTVCDLSGRPLSGLPHTVVSAGGEYFQATHIGRLSGESYLRADMTYRTDIYGDPSDSRYTLIRGYTLVNASLGFRDPGHWEVSVWARNLLNRNYMQNLTVQAGNSGLIVGTPSDPRFLGATARVMF
jgi:iron complex outermembrane recepter protein